MENILVIVLNKKQFNTVEKYRIAHGCQVSKYSTDMKFPFYVHLGHKYRYTAVGWEHIYQPDAKLINYSQFLELIE